MEHYDSFCAECNHFNDENMICTHNNGVLKGIVLSEELADAHHDCIAFDEREYRLTPPALLWRVLIDNDIEISCEDAKKIFDEFMALMIKQGYLATNGDDNQSA